MLPNIIILNHPSYFSQAAPQSARKPHFLLLNGVSQQGAVSSPLSSVKYARGVGRTIKRESSLKLMHLNDFAVVFYAIQ